MELFWGSLICICNYTLPVFDRNLGYYSQDALRTMGNFYRENNLLPVCNNHA